MNRFEYARFDSAAMLIQSLFRDHVTSLERSLIGLGVNVATRSENKELVGQMTRSKAVALTKLEEFYMWAGKAIRDEQALRESTPPTK